MKPYDYAEIAARKLTRIAATGYRTQGRAKESFAVVTDIRARYGEEGVDMLVLVLAMHYIDALVLLTERGSTEPKGVALDRFLDDFEQHQREQQQLLERMMGIRSNEQEQ